MLLHCCLMEGMAELRYPVCLPVSQEAREATSNHASGPLVNGGIVMVIQMVALLENRGGALML